MCTNNNPLYINNIFNETHPELRDLYENLQELQNNFAGASYEDIETENIIETEVEDFHDDFDDEINNEVFQITIVSYWSKVDILPSSENIEDYLILPSDNNTDSIQEMIDCFNFDDPLSANDYIEIDLRLQNQDKLADKEIIELVKGKEVIEEEDNQSQVSEDKITMDQAMESIERLQFFLMQEERGIGISESFLHELNKFKRELKKEILCQWLKQKLTPILVK
ncbi:2141_t:CDS:2 [Entrophospora sp. SA101]|nr:2141_t:CDS:2 [Entrophospora sp. SA101]